MIMLTIVNMIVTVIAMVTIVDFKTEIAEDIADISTIGISADKDLYPQYSLSPVVET